MDCSLPGSSVRRIFQARVLNGYLYRIPLKGHKSMYPLFKKKKGGWVNVETLYMLGVFSEQKGDSENNCSEEQSGEPRLIDDKRTFFLLDVLLHHLAFYHMQIVSLKIVQRGWRLPIDICKMLAMFQPPLTSFTIISFIVGYCKIPFNLYNSLRQSPILQKENRLR